MNIKNKIIKWLGGYTQDELIEHQKIEICRTEKQIFISTQWIYRININIYALYNFKAFIGFINLFNF